MPSVRFTQAARADVWAAVDWYDKASAEIAAHFIHELEIAVERISVNPARFPIALRDLGRTRLRRFPYSLFFRVEPDLITVVACFHARRDPHIWQHRADA